MERILLACDYPNPHKLILDSIRAEVLISFLSDDTSVARIFRQITHLAVFIIEDYQRGSQANLNRNAYVRLFSVCQRLTHLHINGKYSHLNPSKQKCALPLIMCSSSILAALRVNIPTIDDFLRLLAGRFNQMKTFVVIIDSIDAASLNIDNKNDLPNLTYFFLVSVWPTEEYDNLIVPVLRGAFRVWKNWVCASTLKTDQNLLMVLISIMRYLSICQD